MRRRFDLTRPELGSGIAAIMREAGVPDGFPAAVLEEADRVSASGERARSELPFVTIDPPGSRDLDQALHIERRGRGYR